ncbi:unnamed protein product [Rotaria sp. Silwood2]|nr:unnamed protein product [Rotaria sp. Silwood2]CAF4272183.1 unnamed protein product [Rotaria sp. Silwood2]
MGLDLFVRFDCQPKTDSSKSFIGVYNVALKALKDEPFQLINLHGNKKKSPQLFENPLNIIGELTIDRENHIGKMKLSQEFGVHVEFGTPLSNLTAFIFLLQLTFIS